MADWLFHVVGARTCPNCEGKGCKQCEETGKETRWVELGYALRHTDEFRRLVYGRTEVAEDD